MARASASPGVTSRPVSPSRTISGGPPLPVATIGFPRALAAGHALQRSHRTSLGELGRRHHRDVACAPEPAYVMREADELDDVLYAQAAGQRFQSWAFWALAGYARPEQTRRAKQSDGLDEVVRALAVDEATEIGRAHV